jgi:hypothetical protein
MFPFHLSSAPPKKAAGTEHRLNRHLGSAGTGNYPVSAVRLCDRLKSDRSTQAIVMEK